MISTSWHSIGAGLIANFKLGSRLPATSVATIVSQRKCICAPSKNGNTDIVVLSLYNGWITWKVISSILVYFLDYLSMKFASPTPDVAIWRMMTQNIFLHEIETQKSTSGDDNGPKLLQHIGLIRFTTLTTSPSIWRAEIGQLWRYWRMEKTTKRLEKVLENDELYIWIKLF